MSEFKDQGNLKKSYKLLALWFLSLFIFGGLYSAILLRLNLNFSRKVEVLIWLYFINLFLVSLFIMVYKTERVYYINYISFKEANKATQSERRAFAYKHLRVFSIGAIIFIFYSIISLVFKFNTGFDIGVFVLIVAISAIRTVPFRLKEKKF